MRINIKISGVPIVQNDNGKLYVNLGWGEYKFVTYGKDSYSDGEICIETGLELAPNDKLLYIQIGKNTSIAKNVSFNIDLSHDYNSVYQGIMNEFRVIENDVRVAMGQCFKRVERKGEIIIGNDCWIGMNVHIMGGVIIHDGAVIAAGSVVTKDVPPYAIVGGNPAKIIKYRFKPDICKNMQKIAWWNWSSEELLSAKDDMQGDVEQFVKKYISNKMNLETEKLSQEQNEENKVPKFLFFLDLKEEEFIFSKVLDEFIYNFQHKEAELVLCYNACDSEECAFVEELIQNLDKYSYLDIIISIYGISDDEEEKIIRNVDYLITNRSYNTINRITLADIYNVTSLTGIRKPIFPDKLCKKIKNRG